MGAGGHHVPRAPDSACRTQRARVRGEPAQTDERGRTITATASRAGRAPAGRPGRPPEGIAPARLQAVGQLAGLGQGQRFTAVGYGGREAVNQPGGPVIGYLDRREYAVSSFNALGPGYLRLSQNPATGDNGTCYGDSGGPNCLGAGATETNIIAGTTITGDRFCKATNVTYRLDTASARAFLGQFVALP